MANYPNINYAGEESEKPIDFKYYFFLFKKNAYVIVTFFIIVVTIASIYVSKIPDQYQTAVQLMIERPKMKQTDTDMGAFETESFASEYYNTQMKLMNSEAVIRPVVEDLKLGNYFESSDEQAVARLQKMIKIQRVADSRLFNITVTAPEGRLAANIANAMARAYIRKNFEDQLYYSKEVLSWLPSKGELSDKITIENPLGGVTQISREELIESLPSIQNDATIRTLREKKSEQDSELQLLLKRYGEKHPVIIKARSNMKFLDESIDKEKKQILSQLRSQAEGRHKVANARVIQDAVAPQSPLPSMRIKIILIAGVLELILSFLLIILFDYFDDTIRSFEDLERRGLVLPFLGHIPLLKGLGAKKQDRKKALVTYFDKESTVSESFRYLRVAINFSAPPEALSTLVIASFLPHEGKSFVTHNIAISLAQDGNKTLVIDADLRRPTVHRAFELDMAPGLSNFLTSKVDFSSVVRQTEVENLSVITAGTSSPNPGEILGSDRMKLLLEEAHKEFDRVIIDCPPLTGIGDGFVVGSLIGHMILVVAANKTPADLIRHTTDQIARAKIKLIGLVLNMVDMDKERHGGTYSRHYYNTYTHYGKE